MPGEPLCVDENEPDWTLTLLDVSEGVMDGA